MRWLDILIKAGLAAPRLIEILRAAAEKFPDYAAEITDIIAKIEAAIPQSNLIAIAEALPREIANIAQGNLDPRDHPSDLA